MSTASQLNQEYYDKLTAGQEAYWNHMPAPKMRIRAIKKLLRKINPPSLCDFGCGNGALLKSLKEELPNSSFHGVDISANQISLNQENYPQMQFAVHDLTDSNFKNPFGQQMDAIVSSEVIEHLDDPITYVKNVSKCLKSGGHFILSTQSQKIHATEKHVGHVKHWSKREMSGLLSEMGFSDIQVWNAGYPFHDLSKHIANWNPEKTINSFGVSEYGIMQRFVCWGLGVLFWFNSGYSGAQLFAVAKKD